MLNHDCMPNCSWHAVDDVMVVVASQRVDAGTELTIGYTEAAAPLATRTTRLQRHGFVCTCRLCGAERSLAASIRKDLTDTAAYWAATCKPRCMAALDAASQGGTTLPRALSEDLQHDLHDVLMPLDNAVQASPGACVSARLLGAEVRWVRSLVLYAAGDGRGGLAQMEAAFAACFESDGEGQPGDTGWQLPGAPQSPLAATIATQVALQRSLNALHSRRAAVTAQLEAAQRWLTYAEDLRCRISGLDRAAVQAAFSREELAVFDDLRHAL